MSPFYIDCKFAFSVTFFLTHVCHRFPHLPFLKFTHFSLTSQMFLFSFFTFNIASHYVSVTSFQQAFLFHDSVYILVKHFIAPKNWKIVVFSSSCLYQRCPFSKHICHYIICFLECCYFPSTIILVPRLNRLKFLTIVMSSLLSLSANKYNK